jgi:hypothetical protein
MASASRPWRRGPANLRAVVGRVAAFDRCPTGHDSRGGGSAGGDVAWSAGWTPSIDRARRCIQRRAGRATATGLTGQRAVSVTGRHQLAALTALHGARPYPLDAFPAETSYTLLERVLGRVRTRAEPVAAHEIADLCGHLPLTLRIAAANLAHQQSLTLADYARRLRADRLGQLSIPGSPLAVRDAFDVSVDSLPADAAMRSLCWAGARRGRVSGRCRCAPRNGRA